MKIIADLHFHSKFSRATSKKADLESFDKWARNKGIKVVGTSDFTHSQWFTNLKEKLKPVEPGLFELEQDLDQEVVNLDRDRTKFMLTTEISCVYSKDNETRKIHILVFAPDFDTVEEINTRLGWEGKLESDGRPTLGMDAEQLTEIVLNASEDCLVVPAHCLLPSTRLHAGSGIKKIKDFSKGDSVYTHRGRTRKVENVHNRSYEGKIYNIKPYYFGEGLKTTPEHPFYGIKTQSYCPTMGCKTTCKPTCGSSEREKCPHKYFQNYQTQWIPAEELDKGDVLLFPRFADSTNDVGRFEISDYLDSEEYNLEENFIKPRNGTRANPIPNTIEIDKNFCKLVGYYLSEGYTNSRDAISFCFNKKEKDYIGEVKYLMNDIFNLSYCRERRQRNKGGLELIFYSKPLVRAFGRFFYNDSKTRRAHTKCIPDWVLDLPPKKQAEILKGWWRGDTGCTSSRALMNQMKIICLRLGIVPSIRKEDKEDFNATQHHLRLEDREIEANYDSFYFGNLSFFGNESGLLEESCFQEFDTKLDRRHGWIDEKYIYIPIRDIEKSTYKGEVYNLEVKDDNSYLSEFAAVHNCMTPWFALFGSKSGFDSLEACFGDYSDNIQAVETGLSADPAMLWRIPDTRERTLISASDAHSPKKLGREANVFEGDQLSYQAITEAIKKGSEAEENDPLRLAGTIEFYPQEGKYHYDGHRKCEVRMSPQQAEKSGNVCPVCGKPLTIGVMNRVEQLADREQGFKPDNALSFKSLIPLEEIVAEAIGQNTGTKRVTEQYQDLIENIGPEFEVLLSAPIEEIRTAAGPKVAEGVKRVREEQVQVEPGYDGKYGELNIFTEQEQEEVPGQKSLF